MNSARKKKKNTPATQITMYLCNQQKPCNKSPICGKDCKHTNDKRYAKHRELFNEFKPFINPSNPKTLYLLEQEDPVEGNLQTFTYKPED